MSFPNNGQAEVFGRGDVQLVRSKHRHSKVCNELGIRTFLIPGFLPSFSYFSLGPLWGLGGEDALSVACHTMSISLFRNGLEGCGASEAET
jgi:hypothetical protein